MKRLRRAIVFFAVAVLLVWWLLPARGPQVEPGSVLVLQLSGRYVEATAPSILARAVGERRQPFVSVLSELAKAERDERIVGVVLRIRRLQIGWGMAQELRTAIASLRAAGKGTVAYLETGVLSANLEYYVASAADELLLSPGTSSPLVGLGMEFFFLGGLWEKFGVDPEVVAVGEYKSAAEVIGGTEMSPAHREMASALLDSIWTQFVGGIAEGRGMEPAAVRQAIDRAPVTPEALEELGLADGATSVEAAVARLGDSRIDGADYRAVDPAEVGFDPVARFALVYGTGTVVMGEGTQSVTGGLRLASDSVSEALVEAADDPEVDAIIFRVDSPGGSALASEIVWHAAERAKSRGKPLVASVSNMAASGGYYVLAGADSVVAPAGSLVGSIGVYLVRPEVGGLLDSLGIGVASMTRGRDAEILLATRPLTETGRARLEREVLGVYDLFVSRVSEGRGLSTARVDAVGRGRVWTGAQGHERGLVDELGGLRTAVRVAKRDLGLAEDADVVLVPYPSPRGLAGEVADALRGSIVRAALPPDWPPLVESFQALTAALPRGAPALVPPLVLNIR